MLLKIAYKIVSGYLLDLGACYSPHQYMYHSDTAQHTSALLAVACKRLCSSTL